jgi:hypothetical protein
VAVLDKSGKRYSIDAPMGFAGVPFNQPSYLAASLGIGSSTSVLSLYVDNKEQKRTVIPEQVDIGGPFSYGGTIGTDLGKTHFCALDLYYLLVYSRTLGKSEIAHTLDVFKRVVQKRGIK